MSDKCKVLQLELVSLLTDIRDGLTKPTQSRIDDVYEDVLTLIGPSLASHPKQKKRTKGPTRHGGHKRRKKRYLYARTQDLFKKNPNLLAKYIREGVPWLDDLDPSPLREEEVKTFYTSLWGASEKNHIPFTSTGESRVALDLGSTFPAVTIIDINERISRTRKGTAPGLDGIERKHINGQDIREILRRLYNAILGSNIQPTAWNANRTILIPKHGKDLSKVQNYRPITISSLICRIYWGIVDTKLREVFSFSARQKGFVHEAGCFNNVHTLNEILRSAKSRSGLTAIQLDITKAFDTIPHDAIEAALSRLGLPLGVRESILNAYKSLSTTIEHGGSRIEVPIKRGVKQGDPLSPFIFNAILDPLLEQLELMKGFQVRNSEHISALAFADDLILVATEKADAEALLQHTEKYLCDLGMSIAAEKCTSFTIIKAKDSWYITDPGLHLGNGDRVPSSAADSTLCYLGGHVSPWSGLQYRDLVGQLEATFERVRRAQLKPHQKLALISTHILPHFLHKLVLATPPITTIRSMDQLTRSTIKSILHLPASTPNGLLYCSKRDGGLGIPKLEILTSSTALKQGVTLLNTPDPATKALFTDTKLEQRLQNLAKAIRLQWPISNFRTIEAYKKAQKADELRRWSQLKTKGRGVTSFADDRYGNAWLYNPQLLKPSRFLTALRLRSGGTSDRVTMNTVVPQATIKCRKCKSCNETLAHILGQCIYTKSQRIRRHDEIRDFVSQKIRRMKEKVEIIEEAMIQTPTGTNLKPDLVVVNRERVYVVDVTVRHEDTGYLEEGYKSKVDKYTPLIHIMATQLSVKPGRVLPIVLGTRGCMPKSTIDSLRDLNITDRGSFITLSLLALRPSIEIYHSFMDYNALDA